MKRSVKECDGASMCSDNVAAYAPEKCLNVINGQKRIDIKKLEDEEDKLVESLQRMFEKTDAFDEKLERELSRPERPIHHTAKKTADGKFTDYEAWRVSKEAQNKKNEKEARNSFLTAQRNMDDTFYRGFKDDFDQFDDNSADAFMRGASK